MNAFVLNRHGRMVFPTNIIPELDFSTMETLEQLDSVIRRDFDLWLTLCREYAEEFLDIDEARGESGSALSYEDTEPYASMLEARRQGKVRVFVYGMGLDPLTLLADLVCVAVWDADVFDTIFPQLPVYHSEGNLRGARTANGHLQQGYPLTPDFLHDFLQRDDLAPAARAALARTARHLDMLLGEPG